MANSQWFHETKIRPTHETPERSASLWNTFYEEEGRVEKQSNGDHDYFHNYDHDYVQIMLSVGPETYLGLLAH